MVIMLLIVLRSIGHPKCVDSSILSIDSSFLILFLTLGLEIIILIERL
jgi:hypothetical protein